MDVQEMLALPNIKIGDRVQLSGWIVDTNDGLFMLGDHSPGDYHYPYRVKIIDGNIMHSILTKISSLGGGWSTIFYKAKVGGILEHRSPWLVKADTLSIQADRNDPDSYYVPIDIDPGSVAKYVKKYGDYKFNRPRDPMRDWLDDYL